MSQAPHTPKADTLEVKINQRPDYTWAIIQDRQDRRTTQPTFVSIAVNFNRADYRIKDDASDKEANAHLARRILKALAILDTIETQNQ